MQPIFWIMHIQRELKSQTIKNSKSDQNRDVMDSKIHKMYQDDMGILLEFYYVHKYFSFEEICTIYNLFTKF